MTTTPDTPHNPQRTLAQDRAANAAPRPSSPAQRTIARERAGRDIDRAADPAAADAQRALRRVKALLVGWINALPGPDPEFQACDFTRWLIDSGQRPDPALFDLRGLGSAYVALAHTGAVETVGVRNNAGSVKSNYNATPRSVYRRRREVWLFDLGLSLADSAGGHRGVFAARSPAGPGLFDPAGADYSSYAGGAA